MARRLAGRASRLLGVKAARSARAAKRRHLRRAKTGVGIERAVVMAGPPPTKRQGRSLNLLNGVAFAAVLALTLGFSWRDGTAGADEVAVTASFNADSTQVAETKLNAGEAFTAVGSVPPPTQAHIPTARPVQILIPALDVHRAVEGVGVDRSGVLNMPVNAWNAGWYTGGPVPGAPGDAVIEGHAGYPGQPMIFGRLIILKPGDRIIVVLADGSRQLFLVDSMMSLPVGSAPPGLGEPYGPPRLTLLTCTGHFDKGSYSYSQRLVLEATYAGTV